MRERGMSNPHTVKYSDIFITLPHGSIPLTKPERMNTAPMTIRRIHTTAGCESSSLRLWLLCEFDDCKDGIVDDVEVVRVDAFRYNGAPGVSFDLFDALYLCENEISVGVYPHATPCIAIVVGLSCQELTCQPYLFII